MNNESREDRLSLLRDEHGRNADELLRMWSRIEKVIALWITVLGVASGLATREQVPGAPMVVSLLIPSAFAAVLFYILMVLESMIVIGGYVAAVEIEINRLVGSEVLRWESRVSWRFPPTRLSNLAFFGTAVLISIGLVVWSMSVTYASSPLLTLLNFVFVALALSFGGSRVTRFGVIYRTARQATLEGPSRPSDL